MPALTPQDIAHLEHAARLALRGEGGAEPNPMVGCVITSPSGVVVGWGYHRKCGGPHAERVALDRAGQLARGATAYVTMEPCDHTGRTGPCTEALIQAGIARVVIARRDPNPKAHGGVERLRNAGIEVDCTDACESAIAVGDPFAYRIRTGLPWVIVKWAQTIDGRIATRAGESRWISNEASRRLVHRKRGRVDAILTGIGTAKADDPLLVARGVRTRRTARRVVIDPELELDPDSRLVRSAREAPTTIVCKAGAEDTDRASALIAAGVELIVLDAEHDGRIPLAAALRELVHRHDATTVLVEAGPRLVSRLFGDRLVSEAWVFVAPLMLGDAEARACITGFTAARLTDGIGMTLRAVRRRGDDVLLVYGVSSASG